MGCSDPDLRDGPRHYLLGRHGGARQMTRTAVWKGDKAMYRPRIGLLSKKRGNFALKERYVGQGRVADTTSAEVEHHCQSLEEAGYSVRVISWGPNIIQQLMETDVDLVFNVSSLVEAAMLEELGVPY